MKVSYKKKRIAQQLQIKRTKTYSVTFNSNGGTIVYDMLNIPNGTAITEPTPPTKIEKTFGGWYKDDKFTSVYDFSSLITKSIFLYAKWI